VTSAFAHSTFHSPNVVVVVVVVVVVGGGEAFEKYCDYRSSD